MSAAIEVLFEVKSAVIQEDSSKYYGLLSRIKATGKTYGIFGVEYIEEVTARANAMYRRITTNVNPYVEVQRWAVDGSWNMVTVRLHKDSDAYNFYNTSTYKGGMALGKIREVVAPLVSYYSTKAVMDYKASLYIDNPFDDMSTADRKKFEEWNKYV